MCANAREPDDVAGGLEQYVDPESAAVAAVAEPAAGGVCAGAGRER